MRYLNKPSLWYLWRWRIVHDVFRWPWPHHHCGDDLCSWRTDRDHHPFNDEWPDTESWLAGDLFLHHGRKP